MTTATQPCARWACTNSASFDKPLCYPHWQEWDSGELEECARCGWFHSGDDSPVYISQGWDEELPIVCDNCLGLICLEREGKLPWMGGKPPAEKPPPPLRALIRRTTRYVYLLKLSDNTYYAGQTTDLTVRLQEHRDGLQRQTANKNPRLVYYEEALDGKRATNERERELIKLTQSGDGLRKIRQMVEAFRAPLRLLDLEA